MKRWIKLFEEFVQAQRKVPQVKKTRRSVAWVPGWKHY